MTCLWLLHRHSDANLLFFRHHLERCFLLGVLYWMKTGSIIIDKNLSKNVLIFHFINYFSQVYLTFSALQTQTLFYFFLFYFILFYLFIYLLQIVLILMRQLIMSRLIRIYTVCHSCFDFWVRGSLFGTMVLTRFKDGRADFRNLGMKGLNSFSSRDKHRCLY